jgi:Glycine rich protein
LGTRRSFGLAVLALAFAVWAAPASAFTARFVYTGAEQTFTVPTRVSSLQVVAVGATGGPGWFDVGGGPGGVTVAEVPVTPGETLYVEVGGYGSSAFVCCSSSFNGGGAGGADLLGGPGGGGGASDLRRLSRTTPGSESSRLVVAGGGGGAALNGGGAASAAGGSCETCAGPGGPGTTSAGGAGGDAGGDDADDGDAGALGTGGDGGRGYDAGGGGGGGGGYYGGGGGGGGDAASTDGGGAGGGGSSLAVGGWSLATPTFEPPSVTISYRSPTFGPSPIYATPNPLRFNQGVGTVGLRTVTLTNRGTVPLAITATTISGFAAGEFGVGPGCATPLPAGASCELAVRFAPGERGYREAKLAIANNLDGSKSVVILAGNGGAAPKPTLTALRVSPSTFKAGGNALVSYRSDVAGTIKFRVLRVKYRLRATGSGPSRSVSAAFRIAHS